MRCITTGLQLHDGAARYSYLMIELNAAREAAGGIRGCNRVCGRSPAYVSCVTTLTCPRKETPFPSLPPSLPRFADVSFTRYRSTQYAHVQSPSWSEFPTVNSHIRAVLSSPNRASGGLRGEVLAQALPCKEFTLRPSGSKNIAASNRL